MKTQTFSTEIGGKQLTATFSDLAEKANGSVILSCGTTTVLATAVMARGTRGDTDFFPLTVDYEEKFYAAGEILGSRFMRREGRPSDEAILGGRAVDRTIRPLFDKRMRNEVQVIITILSMGEDDPGVLAINAASLALGTSDIPWNGPVGAVRIGKHDTNADFVTNPALKHRQDEKSVLDLLICGKDGNVNMIEAGAKEVGEGEINAALATAVSEITKLEAWQKEIIQKVGLVKTPINFKEPGNALKILFAEKIEPRFAECAFMECLPPLEERLNPRNVGTGSRIKTYDDLRGEWFELVRAVLPEESTALASEYFEEKMDALVHKAALEEGRRVDGRGMDEIRPLYAEAGSISPMLHGVGLFYRGQTHVLSIVTLGGPEQAQIIEGMEIKTKKQFMHHYNFPPFSSGETGRLGGTNRRMIGHGALAEKALFPIIPSKEVFPYTIRVVSEVMSSNGSTSMGSVCAATLALMDAGVPIKKPVAGMAMGLMLGENGDYKILTDIQGPEDHHGDMDFKVAGTRDGITAVQMDIKIGSIPIAILANAFEKARLARLFALDVMEKAMPKPRVETKPSAPKVLTQKIATDKIGLLIGPSGKTINKIIAETGAEISIEEDGTVFVIGKNGAAETALQKVQAIAHEWTPGERVEGEVVRLFEFGVMVKISPFADGLVHVSELAPIRIDQPSDILKEGDRVPVVVKEIDERGRINLSIKGADPDFFRGKIPADYASRPPRPSNHRPYRSNGHS
ncbi:MAG: polyribonucleotide nucleotidyltransferase [Parcubacteria group bacterium]|nr:polyribonucleotide nucleotidyltransferase [Parcubacteria group bacterium]